MSAGGCRATRAHLTVDNRKHRQPQQGQGRTARVALPCGHVRVTRMDWAASETRSFRARSDMLLTMTHSMQILAHRPCDKETDMQKSNSRVPITQPAGCLARTHHGPAALCWEAAPPARPAALQRSRPAPSRPGVHGCRAATAPPGLGEGTSREGGTGDALPP